jgi:hypothetical protein
MAHNTQITLSMGVLMPERSDYIACIMHIKTLPDNAMMYLKKMLPIYNDDSLTYSSDTIEKLNLVNAINILLANKRLILRLGAQYNLVIAIDRKEIEFMGQKIQWIDDAFTLSF